MSDSVDTVVIGAGVVGLTIARALALGGREVVVLEKNEHIGEETSSRNSEVIHAGIYYPADSHKARLCVEGKQLLYAYCEEKGVEFRRCGKLIVAVDEGQKPLLEVLRRSAERNGVPDVRWLDAEGTRRLEPEVEASAALLSPSTGILDTHGLMLALRGDLEQAGGAVAVLSELREAVEEREGFRLLVASGGDVTEILARTVVNAAGLRASEVARSFRGASFAACIPHTRYAKGSYFIYTGSSPFHHLMYPLPVDGGLGIHATLDLAGRVRFGPDVEWIETPDYGVDPARAAAFARAIREYWPALPDGALAPGYAGVRPKLSGPNEPAADFAILVSGRPGGARSAHLFGIESPGLTAALAIGRHVAQRLERTAGD